MHEMPMESIPAPPARPLAAYVGGKRNLAKRLAARIGEIPHTAYVEPFVGMGGVLFARPEKAKVEVINDAARDVATLFRVVQRHYTAFAEFLRYQLTTRAEFERLTATDPATLTDLERAARFLYLQRVGFGGKVVGRTFGLSRTTGATFDVTRLIPMIEDVHTRLAGVVIECLDWETLIRRYDAPHVLFFLDPPYVGTEHYYGRELFSMDDYGALEAALKGLRGRFIMTINDCEFARRSFAGFDMDEASTTYTVAGGNNAARVQELVITGGGSP